MHVFLDDREVEPEGEIVMDKPHVIETFYGKYVSNLLVVVGDGVRGTPAAGSYHHWTGMTIDYHYGLDTYRGNSEQGIMVIWNDLIVTESGSQRLSGDSTLSAWAVNPRVAGAQNEQGEWRLTEWEKGGGTNNYRIIFERYPPWPGVGHATIMSEGYSIIREGHRNYHFQVNPDNTVSIQSWSYQLGERTDLSYKVEYMNDHLAVGSYQFVMHGSPSERGLRLTMEPSRLDSQGSFSGGCWMMKR